MGIYLPNMEMPKLGYREIRIYPDGRVMEEDECGIDEVVGTAEQVPPHGRLGDLDALYEKFSRLESEAMNALKTTTTGSANWIKWSAILTERTGYKHDIADAPTVIQAEPCNNLSKPCKEEI